MEFGEVRKVAEEAKKCAVLLGGRAKMEMYENISMLNQLICADFRLGADQQFNTIPNDARVSTELARETLKLKSLIKEASVGNPL